MMNTELKVAIAQELSAPKTTNVTNHTCDSNKQFDQLVIDNEKFVYSIVNKEFKKYPISVKEDLYAAGKVGLVYAATKFNASKFDNKFISYAVHWIRYYINEEIRNMYLVKLNQSFVYKRNKINSYIVSFKKINNRPPTVKEISEELNISKKVVENTLNINNGENFQFVSFQALSDASEKTNDDSYIENYLVNEYIEQTTSSYEITHFELRDMLEALKTEISKRDYDMFIDKHLNGMSYSDLAAKYNLNFPSSAKYIIECTEKICKKLLA